MKRLSLLLLGMVFLLMTSGLANANLITIGTATYTTATHTADNTSQSVTENVYNLIWNDNNNGNSVVWLDYMLSLTLFDLSFTLSDIIYLKIWPPLKI